MTQEKHYLIRSGALQGFGQVVEELGGHADSLLKQVKLSPNELANAETMIPFSAMVELLEISAKQLNCADFGLRLAAQQGLEILGQLGRFMRKCETLRDVSAAQKYMAIHSQVEYFTHEEHEDFAYINRFEYYPSSGLAKQHKELSMGACYQILCSLLGPKFKGHRIEFSHSPISALNHYRQYFSMDVSFNQEQDRIIFDQKYLDFPVENFDIHNKAETEQYLNQLTARYNDDVERQVKILILQTMGMQEHTIDNIATMLHLHKRTLQRKLKDQNLNFKQILNEVRANCACWHLEASQMDLTLLSELLGYSDISAFSRAFKKQKGLSPLQWRKHSQGQRQ